MGIIKTGLVSVTFRSRTREEISLLAHDAELCEIQWGGDIHVPHGDLEAAYDARILCMLADIGTYSYGSYYRCGGDFAQVADTASALGAKNIRVWAGTKGSADVNEDERRAVVEAARAAADKAGALDMSLSFEFHGGTLTDTPDSALRLLDEIGRPNVYTHWQPNQYRDLEYNIDALKRVADRVDIVHVFAWEGERRLPLSAHMDAWRRYFDILSEHDVKCAMLEFLPSETRDDLLRDAETLRELIEKA